MTIKLALLTGLLIMTLTVVYEGNTIAQQKATIRAMTSNKACMNDSRPEPTPKPLPRKPIGRHDDSPMIGPRVQWKT
jgi:hypothetical protein